MINSGKVVEPTGITVVAEVAQREKDLVRWPAKDKATADNHWRHDSVASSFADGGTSDRSHLKIDNQLYINVCLFDRSNNSTKSLNRNAEPSHRSQVGLKQEYCAVIKKIWSLQFDFGFITTDDSFEQQVQAIAICLQQSTTPAVR